MTYLLLYANDILITYHDRGEFDHLKGLLSSEFEMKDLGAVKKILEMEIIKDKENKIMFLTQQNYIKKFLLKFGMYDLKPLQMPLACYFKLTAEQCP